MASVRVRYDPPIATTDTTPTAPAEPSIFVSYSRAQLALAESVALSAYEEGLQVWFDLLVLTPGREWQDDIDTGLDRSSAVALLVSAESLASANVAREVTRALDRGTPLDLLVVDDTPRRLAHAPSIDLERSARGVFDFRGDFRAAFSRWLSALRSKQTVRDAIPPRRRWLPPVSLPRTVAETALAFIVPIVAITAIAAADVVRDRALWTRVGSMTTLTMAGSAVWLVHAVRLLMKRRLQSEALILSLVAGNVAVWSGLWQTSRSGYVVVPVVSALVTLATSAWAIWRVITDEELMRWIPQVEFVAFNIHRGRQFDRLGELVAERRQRTSTPAMTDPRPYFYHLHQAPDDTPIAEIARETLAQTNCHERAIDDPSPLPTPTIDFLLLSNRLPHRALREFLSRASQYRVVLIASSIQLPDDVSQALARLQYLELRELLAYQLGNFVGALRGWEPSRVLYAENVRPHGFADLVAANGVRQMASAARNIGGMWLAGGLLAAIGLAPAAQTAAIGMAAWQFATVHWLYRRVLPLPVFAIQWLANLALGLWLGTPQLIAERLTAPTPGFGRWPARITMFAFAFTALTGLFNLWTARRWFPRGFRRGDVLDGPPHSALLKGHAVFMLGAAVTAIYVALNQR